MAGIGPVDSLLAPFRQPWDNFGAPSPNTSSFYTAVEVSASALSAERLAMDVIANNIANANTTRTPQGGPFKRQFVVFAQKQEASSSDDVDGGDPSGSRAGVEAVGIVSDEGPDRLVYDPRHPDADPDGYVHYPNIEIVKEMVDMIAASRGYEANVTAIQEVKTMNNGIFGVLKA